jgi:hypothetical protein
MKKLFVIGAVSLSMVLASCGGKEDDAKKEGAAEPKTACDCMKWANTEVDKLLSMPKEEIAKNPKIIEDFQNKIKGNKTCNELTKNMKPEDAKNCPAVSEFMDKMLKFEQMMMGQASGAGTMEGAEETEAADEAMEGDGPVDMPDGEMEEMESPAEGDM